MIRIAILLLVSVLVHAAQPVPDFVAPPVKQITNKIYLSWSNPVPAFSNRITRTTPYSTNKFWIPATNSFQMTIVRTSSEPRSKFTVALLAFDLSVESLPAYWPALPKSNTVVDFWAVQPPNKVRFLSVTNPTGNRFARFWLQPTNAQWPTRVWVAQYSTDLKNWSQSSPTLMWPVSPQVQLVVSNWGF